jgi:hypothetical protein
VKKVSNVSQTGQASLLDGVVDREETAQRRVGSASITTNRRKILAVVFALVSFAVLAFVIVRGVRAHASSPAAMSRVRTVIDAETGKVFESFRVGSKEGVPFTNPDTGRRTLYPAERCFWTKDGKAKLTPTYVLLNSVVGKPEPTICPDCGRKVTGHNPTPPDALMIEAAQAAK